MKNYYAILEVPVGCSLEEIRQAYRRLAQENLDNAGAFAELKEAYETLTTPARRAEYDLAVWGETFAPGGVESTLLISTPRAERMGRCPMGVETHCPVVQMRVAPTDKFCPECGYLLAALGNGSFDLSPQADPQTQMRFEETDGRVHLLRPGTRIAGRENADLLLPDKTVSRQHARLEVAENGEVTIEDLSSTNGTQVNDQSLVPHIPRRLADRDRVRFGSVLTTLHLPEIAEAPPPPGDAPMEEIPAQELLEEIWVAPAAPARAKLVETREAGPDEDPAREFLLPPGITTFGRRAENSVVLQGDPYVSGSHAQILADEDVFRLTDVGSTNGTLKNGERLALNEPVFLLPGDLVVIGGTALRFEAISAEEITGEEITGEETKIEEITGEAPSAETGREERAAGNQDAPIPVEG